MPPRRWEDEQDALRRFQEEAASSPASLFKNAAGRAAYDALMPEPTQLRANTPAEVAQTTGAWSAPAMQARTATPEQQRLAAQQRIAQAELAQRDAEARMRYDIQAQQLAQEGQQQQQRSYLDLIREGARAWEADADRAQQREQFMRTGEESAYRFDMGRADEADRFQREQQRRTYEFEQQRMPSQRDEFLAWEEQNARRQQQEFAAQEFQERAKLQLRMQQMELSQPEINRLQKLKAGLSATQAAIDQGQIDPEMGRNIMLRLQTGIDPLEMRHQQAQLLHMQQQDQLLMQQAAREASIANQNAAFAAKTFDQRMYKDPQTGDRFFQKRPGEWEYIPDKRSEQMEKVQEQRRVRDETVFNTKLKAWESKVATTQKERADRSKMWTDMDQQNRNRLEKMIEASKASDTDLDAESKNARAAKLLEDFEANHEKDMRRFFKNLTGLDPVEGIPASQQYQEWLGSTFPIPEPPMMTETQEPPQAVEQGQQQQMQQEPPLRSQTPAGYSMGRVLDNRQPYVPPGAAQAGGPQGGQPPVEQAPNRDMDDLQALVGKSQNPQARQYGEAAAMMLQEHGDFDRMPPGVQAVFVDLLKAIRGKRDVPPRAHEGRVGGTYGRTGTGGLPAGTAPFGR